MSDSEKKGMKLSGRTIGIIAVVIIAIIIVAIIMVKTPKRLTKSEDAMTALVTEYYEQNIKGKVIGINQQRVTLEALEKAGFDISKVTKNNEYDKAKAYSLVIIENPSETDVSKIVYRVENHLNGQ